jgi:hypothetical protein
MNDMVSMRKIRSLVEELAEEAAGSVDAVASAALEFAAGDFFRGGK